MKIILDRAKVQRFAAVRNETLTGLARNASLDYAHLHRLMRNDCEPSARLRRRICERWGATFDDLFTIVEEATEVAV
jgi:hypothetical protein